MDKIISSCFSAIKMGAMILLRTNLQENGHAGHHAYCFGKGRPGSHQPPRQGNHRLTSRVLKKPHDRTWVIVRFEPRENWFIDGRSLVEHGKNAFRLWVTITDETNSNVEKAEYQKAAFELLSDLIGNVHPISNVYVIDARATAYSYGGVTQEYNFHHAAA
jgi:4-oxalocrotonate tautomerase